jgi:predicted ribosomally synthesized peptide with nif11-like leader
MNENIKAFLQKLSADEALQAQFKAVKDPDKAYELAASVQGGFTKEEFVEAMKELKAKMSRDLSDDDLEKAAGGGVIQDTMKAISETVTVLAAAAAA